MNSDDLKALAKSEIPALSEELGRNEVKFLVGALSEKDDTLRYNAFLLLQANSRLFPLVYEHWSVLEEKLESANSYQRSLGLMLMAENVRWDKAGKFKTALGKYLHCCTDEKFVTSRQAIQGLATVLKASDVYDDAIKQGLAGLQLAGCKENQQKLLGKDVAAVLKIIEGRVKKK